MWLIRTINNLDSLLFRKKAEANPSVSSIPFKIKLNIRKL